MPARITLGTRTMFNLLGPLCNPALAPRQVVGVFSLSVLELAADALRGLGSEHAFVVHSEDGLDEVSLSAPTHVVEVLPAGTRRFRVSPADFGLEVVDRSALAGGDAARNAAILESVFRGEAGPASDVVVMNAAVALVAAGLAEDFRAGAQRARAALDQGAAQSLLEALRAEAA
jgi:anthranilate phosphoribosyltransferase